MNDVFLDDHRIIKLALASNKFPQSDNGVVSNLVLRFQFSFENKRSAASVTNRGNWPTANCVDVNAKCLLIHIRQTYLAWFESNGKSELARRLVIVLNLEKFAMPENWSQQEVEAIVADYFAMLADELQGKPYNKAEHNRNLQKLLNGRDRVSVEFKHRNISAVLWQLNYPYRDGYKPLPRYQGLLREVIEERLMAATELNQTISKSVQAQVKSLPPIQNLNAIQVPPPSRKEVRSLVQDAARWKPVFVQRNFVEAEAKNRSIGLAGEEFILRVEHERLWRKGKRKLADQIEHVARTRGDFMGFDILSFETSGREKFIEVKTTQYAAMTRFFASSNEVEFSDSQTDKYQLYRLFHFDKQPKFFVLPGSLRDTCELKPVNFTAVPN